MKSDFKDQRIAKVALASHLGGWLTMSGISLIGFIVATSPAGYIFLLSLHHAAFQFILVPICFVISFPLSAITAQKCAKHGISSLRASLVVGSVIGVVSSVPFVMIAALLQVRFLFFESIVEDLHWTGVTAFATGIALLYGWLCSSWFWLLINRQQKDKSKSENAGFKMPGHTLPVAIILATPLIFVALNLWAIQWFSLWFYP